MRGSTTAGAFIRQIFPSYYLTVAAATLIAQVALILGASNTARWEIALPGLVLAGFVYAREVLMPRINHARDAEVAGEVGAASRFKRLHRIGGNSHRS